MLLVLIVMGLLGRLLAMRIIVNPSSDRPIRMLIQVAILVVIIITVMLLMLLSQNLILSQTLLDI